MTRKPPRAPLFLRVLGYREERGQWAAHCLETDLVGEGRSFSAALRQLEELTEMQLSFAAAKKQPVLFHHPAPLWVIETYSRLAESRLRALGKESAGDRNHELGSLSLPSPRRFAIAGA